MTKLHRYIQGIHIKFPKCLVLRQGILVIGNDDATGITCAISVECSVCQSEMMRHEV